mgnify:CR=1 FL=1
MVVAQGGDLEDLHRPVKVDQVLEVTANQDGVIAALPAMEFGLFAMRLVLAVLSNQIPSITKQELCLTKKWESTSKKGNALPVFSWRKKNSQERVTEFKKNVKILERAESVKEIIEIIS